MPSINDERYEKLTGESPARRSSEDLTASLLRPILDRPKTRRNRYLVGITLTLALATIILLSIAQLVMLSSHNNASKKLSHDPHPCGTTPHEAKAKGCIYSWSLGIWMHPNCYDKEIEDKFSRENEFVYYYAKSDNSGPDYARPLKGPEELAMVPHEERTWSTWRYHVAHCQICFAYVHRAGMYNRKLPAGIAGLDHTDHCKNVTTDESAHWGDMITEAVNNFPACVYLEEYRHKESL